MKSPILKRTRMWTLAAAVAVALVLNTRFETRFVMGFLGSAVWAVLSFWVVEVLMRVALVPPGTPRNGGKVARLIAAKAALYAVALWVLLTGQVPPVSCILGFSLLLCVLVVVGIIGRPKLSLEPPTE